jgi:aminopeptidase N
MYYKGGNMLHTIRQVINDDEKFRAILRGLNSKFYHSVVTTKQIESYMSEQSGKDLSKIFDQYLRTTKDP